MKYPNAVSMISALGLILGICSVMCNNKNQKKESNEYSPLSHPESSLLFRIWFFLKFLMTQFDSKT